MQKLQGAFMLDQVLQMRFCTYSALVNSNLDAVELLSVSSNLIVVSV